MIRHVLFTGEIGSGKSTALSETVKRLSIHVMGLETYSPQPRGVLPKTLYLRAYGTQDTGTLMCILPDGDRNRVTSIFDMQASALLESALEAADVIVMDEIGRLEKDAAVYHQTLRCCFDSGKPVLGVLRKHKAEWADWIRKRDDVLLLEVTEDNRDALPEQAAKQILNILAAR